MGIMTSAIRVGGPAILCISLGAGHGAAQRVRTPERETVQLVLARICAHEASLPTRDEGDADGDGDREEWVHRRAPERAYGADCAGIHEVLLRGAVALEDQRRQRAESEGRTFHPLDPDRAYITFAHMYSGRMFTPPATDGNRWAFDLRSDGSEPMGWRRSSTSSVCTEETCRVQRGPSWARGGRDAWLFVYALAGDLAAHDLSDVHTWSPCEGPVDDWGGRMDHAHARSIGLIEVTCGPEGTTANTFYARPTRVAVRARDGVVDPRQPN
jgi:hypothetical protein